MDVYNYLNLIDDGFATSKMIVAIIPTSEKTCVLIKVIANALNPNSDVIMPNVSQPDGSVIMMMIVGMDPTNENAQITRVRQKDSNVRVGIVLKKNLNVMEIATAWICQMKWIALLGIRMENTVLKINLNVITIFVYDKMIYVMVLMIVMTARMKRKSFVVS